MQIVEKSMDLQPVFQKKMKELNDGSPMDYEALLRDIDEVPRFAALVDPDDPRFLAPANMPVALNTFLCERGKAPLHTPAAFARCIIESLVLRHREVFQQLSQPAPRLG